MAWGGPGVGQDAPGTGAYGGTGGLGKGSTRGGYDSGLGPHGEDQEPALGFDAYGNLSGTTESEKDFVDRMNEQGEDLKDSDIRSLYGTLTEKDINTRTVSVKNLGKFAKNAITRNVTATNPQGDVLGYFGEVPSFGMSGIISRLAGIDMKGLVLGPELSGEEPGGGRPDTASPVYYQGIAEEALEGTPIEGTPIEGTPIEEIPFEGYSPSYSSSLPYYYTTYANGGVASLPANFNPMTGVNPFRRMMNDGGRIGFKRGGRMTPKRGLVTGPGGYMGQQHGGAQPGEGGGPAGSSDRMERQLNRQAMDAWRAQGGGEFKANPAWRQFRQNYISSGMAQWRAQAVAQQQAQADAIAAEQQAAADAAAAQQQAAADAAAAQQQAAADAAAQQQAAADAATQQQADPAAQQAEQDRLAQIEAQRLADAQAAEAQRLAAAAQPADVQALDRPALRLPQYSGYTPMDYDASKTGSLTDWYARMLNVPWAAPFMAQSQIQGPKPETSIFGIDSLLDPVTLRKGGRVGRMGGGMGGGMMIIEDNDVVNNGMGAILNKYKQIRSEL